MLLIDEYINRYSTARESLKEFLKKPETDWGTPMSLSVKEINGIGLLLEQYSLLICWLINYKRQIRYPVEPDLESAEDFLRLTAPAK